MDSQLEQVKALREAIIQRAGDLADEHISQGKLERNRILHEVRDKVQVMEKKELLAAKDGAEREYQRLVQASELKMQAELDRNRWGLVQSVMDSVMRAVGSVSDDMATYQPILVGLLRNGVSEIGLQQVVAEMNSRDRKRFADQWPSMTADIEATITLSDGHCDCSGGVRVFSQQGDIMVDNTFEGIIMRRQDQLMRVIFERLFSQVQGIGGSTHG